MGFFKRLFQLVDKPIIYSDIFNKLVANILELEKDSKNEVIDLLCRELQSLKEPLEDKPPISPLIDNQTNNLQEISK